MSRFKILGALVVAVASSAILAVLVLAWTRPMVTPICAPDETHYAFIVRLEGQEKNYDFQWSYGSHGPWSATINGVKGDNILVTPIGEGDLYVRWASDHKSKGYAKPDTSLCETPTPTPTAKPTPTPSPPSKPRDF